MFEEFEAFEMFEMFEMFEAFEAFEMFEEFNTGNLFAHIPVNLPLPAIPVFHFFLNHHLNLIAATFSPGWSGLKAGRSFTRKAFNHNSRV